MTKRYIMPQGPLVEEDGKPNHVGHNYLKGIEDLQNQLNTITGGDESGATVSVIDWVTPQQFGAVADGTSHPLSEFYDTLVAAQGAYDGAFYFITSLDQEMDYAACKAASNKCFGGDLVIIEDFILVGGDAITAGGATKVLINAGSPDMIVDERIGQVLFITYVSAPGFVASSPIVSNTARVITVASSLSLYGDGSTYAIGFGEHGELTNLNKTLYLPAGTYYLGDDTWTIRNLRSGIIQGAGKLVTDVQGTGDAVLQFDGIWYSSIADFAITQLNSASTAALDIDGNVPGHDYDTRGVQGCTLSNLYISGSEATYAFSLNRQGGNGAQGSEMTYINLHLGTGSFACYYQQGFNALANTFIGGNFQDYGKHGAYITGGTFGFINTGFQSTRIYEQFLNEGWDISCGDSGAFEGCPIYGCRTESLFFLHNGGAVNCDIRACIGATVVDGWFPSTTYDTAVSGREWVRVTSSVDGTQLLMVATTAGSSGLVEPTWNVARDSGGTVADNDIIWTECKGVGGISRGFMFIENKYGSVSGSGGRDNGYIYMQASNGVLTNLVGGTSTASACLPAPSEMGKFAYTTTGGPLTIPIPNLRRGGNFEKGRTFFVGRGDEVDDVIINMQDLGGRYKRAATGNTFTLPKLEGAVTWVCRETGADGYAGWVMQSSMYLRDMTADFITDLNGNELVGFTQASTGADNYVNITNSDTGTAVKIEAAGSDTDVDLLLGGKGTGKVKMGTHTGIGAETVTGYITIKDAGGTLRKLAVVS